MDDFTRTLNEQLRNPEFKKEWSPQRPERNMIRSMIKEGMKPVLLKKSWPPAQGYSRVTSAGLSRGIITPLRSCSSALQKGWANSYT